MSMKDKVARLKDAVHTPSDTPINVAEKSAVDHHPAVKPSTAPGNLLAFKSKALEYETTIQALEDRLSQYAGSYRTLKLDTALIDESKWANRHASSFDSLTFDQFKDEIAHAGGNIQAALVRPKGERYELVYGHRRYTACKQLELPLLATIMDISDEDLFIMMDRENRQRLDLSPYEQGEMWRRALEDKLFPSASNLASHVGASKMYVVQCLAIAKLPRFILELFDKPTEIQVRWAKAINDLLEQHEQKLRARAQAIKAMAPRPASSKIFEMLTTDENAGAQQTISPIKRGEKVVGKMARDANGKVQISIRPGQLSQQAFDKLAATISDLLGK